MVYVSSSVKDMYLSCDSLPNLRLLPRTFPPLGDSTGTPPERENFDKQPHASCASPENNAMRPLDDNCPVPTITHNTICICLQHRAALPGPSKLPFPCGPENNAKMKAWLLARYASSTFNTCPHRVLPCMEGSPKEIHVDPVATHQPTYPSTGSNECTMTSVTKLSASSRVCHMANRYVVSGWSSHESTTATPAAQ